MRQALMISCSAMALARICFAPSDSPSGGATTLSGAQQEAAKVEGDVNAFLPIVSALIPGAGAAISAGVSGGEAVANTIINATASHAAPLTIATGAISALATNAGPVIATLPEGDQATGNAILNDLKAAMAAAEGFFGSFKW